MMINTINEFAGNYRRFFIKKGYEGNTSKALFFLLFLVIGFIGFYLAELVGYFYLKYDGLNNVSVNYIISSMVISIIMGCVIFFFFVFFAHYMTMFFKQRVRLKDTFSCFVYSLIPLFLIIPIINIYSVLNATVLADSVNTYYTHLLIIFWMACIFILLSMKMYGKGMSMVHGVPESKVFFVIIITIGCTAAALFLLPVPFQYLLAWLIF